MLDPTTCLAFDDVLLVPTFTKVRSRLAVDTSSYVGPSRLNVPLIASPMDTITDSKMAIAMGQNGGMGIVHRYMTAEAQIDELKNIYKHMKDTGESIPIAFAVGIKDEEMTRFDLVSKNVPHIDMVCIDVANGHSVMMEKMIKHIRRMSSNKVKIIAGNVATGDGFEFLAKLGVDAVRVGIGSGSICKTRIVTGFGVPLLSSVIDASVARRRLGSEYAHVSIIADGGIRYPADLVKSLVAGADAIIGGRIFSGTAETPGDVIQIKDQPMKEYRGMASRGAQGKLKKGTCAEGVTTYIPYAGPVEEVMEYFAGGLRSAMTYANAMDLSQLRKNAKFVRITDAGVTESHAFGTRV